MEELRQRAESFAARAAADRSGSTFQARFERDVTAHHHATRAARYTFGDLESLVFGRLDRGDGETLHVGRVSVVDEDKDVLLVDWRAPAAAAFYQATAAQPLGVARRRTLVTEGPVLHDLDDEILDAEAAEDRELVAVTGQGALLAALSRERTGHMRDIVATIQADQDRIIRLPAAGTVIVRGGPGTGKTVVALHRVAYLLYTHRERFEGRGVLVVGPSGAFTEYISRVLPSLGEDRAVLRALGGFTPPGVRATGWDEPDVAALKGDLRMVDLAREVLRAVLPPLPPETRVSLDGTTAVIRASELSSVRDRLLRRVDPEREGAAYHDRSQDAERAMMGALWRSWRKARLAAGEDVPDDPREVDFDDSIAEAAQVVMLRRCFWPALDVVEVFRALVEGGIALERVGADLFEPWELAVLGDRWETAEGPTVDDVAVLDELRALLGTPPEERRTPATVQQDGITLSVEREEIDPVAPEVEDIAYADFAHVVVDEAQDLTPLQWRMLARRGRYASWTVVGDLAQRSRVAEPETWDDVARLIGRRNVTVTGLTVNYRTPTEIVDVAREVLRAAGHDPGTAPSSVRSTGERPVLVRTDTVSAGAADAALDAARRRGGTVGIVALDDTVGAIQVELAAAGTADLVERIRVLDPRTVKGLEFDDVVVADPDRIAASSAVGLHQLYVAVTRATRSLVLVARPEASVPGERHLLPRSSDAAV